jgi:hypothetical protein
MMRPMRHKPHHRRHRPYSERNQVFFLAGFVLIVVLILLALFLWWTDRPEHVPP